MLTPCTRSEMSPWVSYQRTATSWAKELKGDGCLTEVIGTEGAAGVAKMSRSVSRPTLAG